MSTMTTMTTSSAPSAPPAPSVACQRRSLTVATVIAGLALLQPADAMAIATAKRGRPTKSMAAAKKANEAPTLRVTPVIPRDRTEEDFYKDDDMYSFLHQEYNDEHDDFLNHVDGFQQLQRSTGSDILDQKLQQQIKRGTIFDHDTSYFEKVAMSSIPEQLPRAAVTAFSAPQTTGSNNSNSGIKRNNLNFAGKDRRVTHQQELELGEMIQKGATLHTVRTKFEQNNGRTITRQEWSKLANLTVKDLRHTVANYRNAKQVLVAANVGLVHAVVKQQYYSAAKRSGVSFEELVQEGTLGLIRAAELFDPSRGLRFSTYATIWIKGQLGNTHVKETIKVPLREKTKWKKYLKAEVDLRELNGAEPNLEELSSHLGMGIAKLVELKRRMCQTSRPLSLDYEYQSNARGGGNEGSMVSERFLADVDLAERNQMQADLVAAMASNLDAREARLMRLRYLDGQPRTLGECAEAMGLSQTRVQQLNKTCLKKLREAAEAESLQEYFLTIA